MSIDLRDLPILVGQLTTKADAPPASNNRAITLYAVPNETVTMQESVTTAEVTPPFQWSDGVSANRLIWGMGEWRS